MCHTSDNCAVRETFYPPMTQVDDTKDDTNFIPKDVRMPGNFGCLAFSRFRLVPTEHVPSY